MSFYLRFMEFIESTTYVTQPWPWDEFHTGDQKSLQFLTKCLTERMFEKCWKPSYGKCKRKRVSQVAKGSWTSVPTSSPTSSLLDFPPSLHPLHVPHSHTSSPLLLPATSNHHQWLHLYTPLHHPPHLTSHWSFWSKPSCPSFQEACTRVRQKQA